MHDFLASRRLRMLWTALAHLAASREPVPGKELARRLDCSGRYLESDLQSLAQAGVLESRRGSRGGYLLAVNPQRVTLAQVLDIVAPPQNPRTENACALMREVVVPQLDAIAERLTKTLDELTLADTLEEARARGLLPHTTPPADFII